jgi:hypothetical protein
VRISPNLALQIGTNDACVVTHPNEFSTFPQTFIFSDFNNQYDNCLVQKNTTLSYHVFFVHFLIKISMLLKLASRMNLYVVEVVV